MSKINGALFNKRVLIWSNETSLISSVLIEKLGFLIW